MTEYYLPTGYGTSEFVEKKSRFIGEVWRISTEEEARQRVAEVKKKYHDARHSCWCYLLRDGTVRYSDDGEPQGTAGQPMLEVFSREGITDCVCIVTRYFGGNRRIGPGLHQGRKGCAAGGGCFGGAAVGSDFGSVQLCPV